MELVPIEAGSFVMGSEAGDLDELPLREVHISSSFHIGAYQVTNAQYEQFDPSHRLLRGKLGFAPDDDDAVVFVSWHDANAFCQWLSEKEGKSYRLPTEAEWEYAARAGSETEYFFADDAAQIAEYAVFKDNAGGKTAKVGTKKANPWGLYDILGNVSEWTYDQYDADFYKTLEGKVSENPVNVPTKLYPHVVRGGSFESEVADLRSAARGASDPIWKQLDPQIPKSNWWFPEAPFVGMRLVRPVKQPSHEEIMAYYDKAPLKDF